MTTPHEPGWYDDPQNSTAQRYWDGQNWTPHRQRKPTSRPAQPSVMPAPNLPPPRAPNLPPPPATSATLPPPPAAAPSPEGFTPQAEFAPFGGSGPFFGQQPPGNAYVYKNPVLYAVGGIFFPPLVLFLMGGNRTICALMLGLWILFWLTIWLFFLGGIFLVALNICSVVACYQEAMKQNLAHGFA